MKKGVHTNLAIYTNEIPMIELIKHSIGTGPLSYAAGRCSICCVFYRPECSPLHCTDSCCM
ncbi:hypothetical protein BDV97DRAFT_354124 [Delphinella strobiligena]|nr:hypothetical protein BDV97DRAFT_354124 [Delphinella strobiligena]